uniref:Uncharacterized protein n=1 Tax=Rhizophora mucronata TaxID=61149 RepID=A0A2P2IZM7_RHIMU
MQFLCFHQKLQRNIVCKGLSLFPSSPLHLLHM